MQPSYSVQDLSENLPGIGALSIFTSTVFGNTNFMLAPSQTGRVNFNFGTMPYFSLEGQLVMQTLLSSVKPESIIPGQNQGQQNISGQYTITGSAGNVQAAIGYATTTSGGF